MNIYKTCVVMAALAIASFSAQAHYLWIESEAGNAVLRFGEFAENARERSPGRLDEIPDPQATLLSAKGNKAVALKRAADGFLFPAESADADLIVEEKRIGVRDWSGAGIGIVKPMFYARSSKALTAAKPLLALDIVPTGKPEQFQVWFQNQPLPKGNVTIYAPNGWVQEFKTDKEGNVTLAQPWRGQYVVEVIFLEKTAGEFEGKAYEAVRHRATLTFKQNNGPETFAVPTANAMH
jgi:hypothetical protein